jgi:YidC/Oxa1 family membrane protein insertase
MNTEARLLLAVTLMIGVIFGTQILFPSPEPVPVPADSAATEASAPALPDLGDSTAPVSGVEAAADPTAMVGADPAPTDPSGVDPADATEQVQAAPPQVQPREIVVAGPLYEYRFSNIGARLLTATLPEFDDLAHDGRPPVQLVPEGATVMGRRLVIGQDTLDLRELGFSSDAPDRVEVGEDVGPVSVDFTYRNPAGSFTLDVTYTFEADSYVVDVETRISGVDRPLLLTSLGDGIAYAEADSTQEARTMAYVTNGVDGGIDQRQLDKVDAAALVDGPFVWTAIKSKYFVIAMLPGAEQSGEALTQTPLNYVGGIVVTPTELPHRAGIEAAMVADASGLVEYRMYVGPQEYGRLKALGNDFQEVNPYGWAFFRAVVRPFVGAIVAILNWTHNTLGVGYGWVLILFGVALRIMLWPLNAKAMRAQIRNMAVQPLVKEIQTKYKDDKEKQQQELMRLYKEHGFNPVAGCLPMLLPWPILIALFFVFQNAIELRGVPFLWLPDLSAKDPLFLLPAMLALSMFLIQWITYKSMPQDNPQMKMMMWFMPIFLGVIFLNFPSGLNLYYASMNVATLPQQVLIANERKKVKPLQPGGSRPPGGDSGGDGKKGGKRKKARSRG